MHPQSTEPQYRVTFNHTGVEPVTAPADATIDELTALVRRAFLAAELVDVDDDFSIVIDGEDGSIMITSGEVTVIADGDEIEHAFITRVEPEPDYWLTLADDLRQAAGRLATLAGTPGRARYVTVNICAGLLPMEETSGAKVVDVLAAAFGVEATTGHHKNSSLWEHRVDVKLGKVELSAFAHLTKPADVEETLRARVAELEARLSAGGAQ